MIMLSRTAKVGLLFLLCLLVSSCLLVVSGQESDIHNNIKKTNKVNSIKNNKIVTGDSSREQQNAADSVKKYDSLNKKYVTQSTLLTYTTGPLVGLFKGPINCKSNQLLIN